MQFPSCKGCCHCRGAVTERMNSTALTEKRRDQKGTNNGTLKGNGGRCNKQDKMDVSVSAQQDESSLIGVLDNSTFQMFHQE